MKIAFFSDTYLPEINSVSISLQTLAEELSNRGHDITIFTTGKINNPLESPFEMPSTIKIYRATGIFSHSFKRNSAEVIHRDFREIIDIKPDIIHIHTPFTIGRQGKHASELLRIPLIGSHHTFYANYRQYFIKSDSWFSRRLVRNYTAWFYNHCKLVITPSKAIGEDLIKYGFEGTLSIVPNPINIKKLVPSAPKEILKKNYGLSVGQTGQTDLPNFSLVYFGRLTYEKRLNELFKVFALLSQKYPQIKLSIIGDGPEKTNLEKYAKLLKIRDKIIFFGFLRDQNLIDAVAANDIFISASDTENQPLPIFEAMALGLPQIVAKSPIDEYVENDVTGFIAKEYNFMELSKEATKLIENPALCAKMSENSKKAALKYDISHIAEEYEIIYRDFTTKFPSSKSLSRFKYI